MGEGERSPEVLPEDTMSGTATIGYEGMAPASIRKSLIPPGPRYELCEVVGRGGMGWVRRVRDRVLLRDVAVKALDPSHAQAPWLRKFVDEARVTGQLEHPNIVPVHELALDAGGDPYFTMKLVRGLSLEQWLDNPLRPPGSSDRLADGLEIFVHVCDAIAYAHSRGVLHRDLKPSNVMVGEFGEVYVMDWGVSKVFGPGIDVWGEDALQWASEHRDDGIVGTLAYMAPEQSLGGKACDVRTDVFGLGCILYEIVTGELPYDDDDPTVRLSRVRRGDYTPVRERLGDVAVSRKLVQIVEKAMAASPDDRYQSACALRADVRAFLRGGLYLPTRTFEAGAKIVVQGDSGDEAYIIVRGECEAYKTVDGERRVLRRMGPGQVFGEMAILSNVPRTATVEALEPVTAMVITREVLEGQLDTWVGALFRSLAERFRELDAKVHGTADAH